MKNRFIICCILQFAWCIVCAQDYQFHTKSKSAIKYLQRATHYYDLRQNDEAITELLNALKEDENFLEAQMLIGDVYADKKQFDKAATHYRSAIKIDPDFFPQNFLNLAKAEMQLNEFDSAKVNLENFLSYKSKSFALRDKAEELKKTCNFAAYAVKHPVLFNPINMGDSINTPQDEYLPALTADDLTLVFTRRRLMAQEGRMKDYNEDFYISKKINGNWINAINMGPPINTNGNEGAHCIAPDGMSVYFTACNREGYKGCDLYFSRRSGNRWSTPLNMGAAVNSESWDSQPSISSDGKTIYFLSSRPGGIGKQDIWKTTKNEDGSWSKAVNLGSTVNTSGNELSPFIHPDNVTLYFASDGHPGMGGTDMYLSRMGQDGNWQMPVDLGYPINTGGDESSLFVNAEGNLAFFASDRFKEGKGKLDIYSFDLYPEARPAAVSYLKGTVKDKVTKAGLEADFEMIDIETGMVTVSSISDKSTGEFLVCLPSGKNYALNVSKEGYLFYSDHFSCKNINDRKNAYQLDILLSQAKAGEMVVLKNTFYETNSFDLKPESFAELNKVISFMKHNAKIIIEVSGHTDNVGDIKSNQVLSEKRAKSVYDYIIKNGIAASQLVYKGYGESKPIASNATEEGRSQNRRTEFTITAVK